jgi:hypothetical protein
MAKACRELVKLFRDKGFTQTIFLVMITVLCSQLSLMLRLRSLRP